MAKIDELDDFHPLTRDEWRAWLAKNHDKLTGVWFVFFKKATGKQRASYDEAVEEALCFGWIDSLPRKLDDERSKLLFTPRKPRSVWSKINKERVDKMLGAGLMTAVGLQKIQVAKRDGSWNALDESDNLHIPLDLGQALQVNPAAQANFGNFSDSSKKNILQWIANAKRDETRRARIQKTVRMASVNQRANFDIE